MRGTNKDGARARWLYASVVVAAGPIVFCLVCLFHPATHCALAPVLIPAAALRPESARSPMSSCPRSIAFSPLGCPRSVCNYDPHQPRAFASGIKVSCARFPRPVSVYSLNHPYAHIFFPLLLAHPYIQLADCSPRRTPLESSVVHMSDRRSRAWSISCSSTTSQSSIPSIYPKINQSSPLAEPTEGHINAYGSFATTLPATLRLRIHLSLVIPDSRTRRARQRDLDYDTPPDSPLSFFQSPARSSRSPSISRTLLSDSDLDWGGPSSGPVTPLPLTSPPSPSLYNDAKLHPVLEAVEKRSKFSCRAICSTCRKAGSNFPRCPRCGDMWCSRPCRLQGAKKHTCAVRKM